MSINRDAIYEEVDAHITEKFGVGFKTSGQCCLYWMMLGINYILANTGLRAIPQAGSVSWPIVAPELDDGVCATHFSMMWNTPREEAIGIGAAEVSESAVALPEMHCWIAIPETGEIVDFSTLYLPRIAEKCGFQWRAPLPPRYLWTKARKLPERVFYEPNLSATKLAIQLGLTC